MIREKTFDTRAVIAASVLALGLCMPLTAAFAETNTVHHVTETTTETNPCTGLSGEFTVTYNGLEHFSTDANDGQHGTFTQTGTFTFEQSDGITYTGHVTIWGGFNSNSGTNVETSIIAFHGTGSDGSTIRANGVTHDASNPSSGIDNLNCRLG